MQSRYPLAAAAVSSASLLRVNSTDSRISYFGSWEKLEQLDNWGVHVGSPGVASFYFTGSSLSIYGSGTKDDAIFMVDGRPELCIPHVSTDDLPFRVDCTPPFSFRPHRFRMETSAFSFAVSHFEIHSTYPTTAQASTDAVLHRLQQYVRQLLGRAEPTSSIASGASTQSSTSTVSSAAPSTSGVVSLPPPNICTSPSGCVGGICPDPVQCPQDYSTTSIYATVSGGDGFPGGGGQSVVSNTPNPTSSSPTTSPGGLTPTPDLTSALPSASASATVTPSALDTSSSPMLSHGSVAAIAVCSTLGALILISLVWLARRGTFGSGRLLGIGFGAARYTTAWRGAASIGAGGGEKGAGAVPVQPGEAGYVVTPFSQCFDTHPRITLGCANSCSSRFSIVSPPVSSVGDPVPTPLTPSSARDTPGFAAAPHVTGSSSQTGSSPPGLTRAPSTYKAPFPPSAVNSTPAGPYVPTDAPPIHASETPDRLNESESDADATRPMWPQARRGRRQSQDAGIRLEGGPLSFPENLPPAYDG
ncbi:hypothetical protein C2E23DRAFT_843599 [Lenzites betulinus]|nr:hypothetical protein C2E23DRAFT_843599 [Lenzites betulinus]